MNERIRATLTEAEQQRLCEMAAGAGDAALEAFDHLLGAYHGRFLSVAKRRIGSDLAGKIEPEDILQQAYIDAFKNITQFSYAGPDSFYRWVALMIDHKFIDCVRRLRNAKRNIARESRGNRLGAQGSAPSRHEAMLEQLFRTQLSVGGAMQRQDAVMALMACIAKLPEDYRNVVQNLYLDEEPMKVVAERLGKSEDAVRRTAGRAVDRLGECLGRASRYLSGGV